MLFSKKIEPRCEYCKWGSSSGEARVLCVKRGVMQREDRCRKFRYDPLKRTPVRPAMPDFTKLKDSDFSL